MDQLAVKAAVRKKLSKGESNRIRREGGVPAVIYGRNIEAVPIVIDAAELKKIDAQNGRGLVELNIEGSGKQHAMIDSITREPLKKKVLHIDFHAVSLKEPVDVEVPIALTGTDEQTKKDGVLQQALRVVMIHALPSDVPESITVNIADLKVGDTIRAKDLTLPVGSELKTDPDEVIVSVIAPVNAPPETDIEPKEPELVHDTEGEGVGAADRPGAHE